jgi:hypothetical protein
MLKEELKGIVILKLNCKQTHVVHGLVISVQDSVRELELGRIKHSNLVLLVLGSNIDLVHMSTNDLVFQINQKLYFLISKKSEEKNLHIANNVSHKRVKYQFQILYILNYTKMTKM